MLSVKCQQSVHLTATSYQMLCLNISVLSHCGQMMQYPCSKVHGANMGHDWILSVPDEPHVGPWTLLSGYRSTFVPVMACCLMTPSHYLNQCSLTIHEAHWHLAEGNVSETVFNIILYKVFEKYRFENLPGTNLLKNDRDGCMKSYDIKLPNNNVLLDYNQSILWPSMYCPIASMVSYPLVESIGTNHATKHLGQLFKYYLGIWWHLNSKLFQRIDNSTST